MNNIIIPVHKNNNRFNLSNEFLYPKTKKIIIDNQFNKLNIEKTGMFKRKLTLIAVNTNYTYSSTENLLNPHIVFTRNGFKMCKHPQNLLYRDERGAFRKILDSVTGRKDYDVYFKNNRQNNNSLTVITTTHRDMFTATKIKTFITP